MGSDVGGSIRADDALRGNEDLPLPEFDAPPADPLLLLVDWVCGADRFGVREPLALVLATTGRQGQPCTRVVLVKSCDRRGLVFSSHYCSAKGRDLAATKWAAGTLYWRETLQQVNLGGPVARTTEAESDALFMARPLAAQATTVVSRQSDPLHDERALRERAAAMTTAGATLDRPADWGGYRLEPAWIEFWHGRRDRFHRRLRYDRTPEGWSHQRLQP